jgi:hypothetical protein
VTTVRITVEDLARDKAVPAEFLRSARVGLTDLADGGVAIPYWSNSDAAEPVVKRRTALKARDGSWWPKGTPPMAYGEWRLDEALRQARLVLVEGESDCWACWLAGYPALGIPGASNSGVLRAEHLDGVDVLFISREADQAGDVFVSSVLDRLFDLRFRGHPRDLRMPPGCKDPGQLLQLAGAASFPIELERRLNCAGRLALPPETASDAEVYRMLKGITRNPEVCRWFASKLFATNRPEKKGCPDSMNSE